MSETIRVGVIGANPSRGWAQTAHLPALAGLPGFSVSAVSTTRIESARETAEQIGAPHAFADATELATCDEVDVVAVCVRVPHHHELVGAALDAGKHVLCEWPLGADSAEAADLTARARAAGVHHVIGLQGRKSPTVNYLRHLVADGYVGPVRSATVTFVTAGRGGPTIAPDRVWTADRRAGVTLLSVPGGHTLDGLRYCLGEIAELSATVATLNPVTTVAGTGERIEVSAPDHVFVQGTFESGALFSAEFCSAPRTLGLRIGVYGDGGSLVLEGGSSLQVSDGDLALSGQQGTDAPAPIAVPGSYASAPESVPPGAGRNVAGLYLALGAAIADGTAAEPDFATASELHHLLDTIETASATGRVTAR